MAAMPGRVLTVPSDPPPRLDAFLASAVPGLSAARARALLAQGRVRVNGKVAKPARRLWGGEAVELDLPGPTPAPRVEGPRIPVLYQDPRLLVVDKPAGLVVDEDGGARAVVTLLASQVGGFDVGGRAVPGVAHRLDRDTTGCLALARTDEGLARLTRAFAEKRVDKRYLGLVLGEPAGEAVLEAPYGRDPTDPRRFTTRVRSARRARLTYRTQRRWAGVALLELELDTGRTHQIRVQLSEAGLPLLGDPVYGTPASQAHPAAKALGRIALHAARLTLTGVAEQELAAEAPLPPDFQAALASLASSARP